MSSKLLSSGYIVGLQWLLTIVMMFFTIIMLFLINIPVVDLNSVIFSIIFLIIEMFFLWRLLVFADIYVDGDCLIYKKILLTKVKRVDEIVDIDEGFFSFVYFVKFSNNKKIYFQLKPNELFNKVLKNDSDKILDNIKKDIGFNSYDKADQ
jgi:hypothetical protein